MTSHLSHRLLVLTVLQHVSADRLQRAATALADGSITVTPTRTTQSDIRALVKNDDGQEYGCTITEGVTTCSCRDALYRGVICKHVTILALAVLRATHAEPPPRTIHFVVTGTTALCGVQDPQYCWQWPHFPMTEWAEACPQCTKLLHQPILALLTA
jgi:SWIM zinc finger